jgi:hypothetical protein
MINYRPNPRHQRLSDKDIKSVIQQRDQLLKTYHSSAPNVHKLTRDICTLGTMISDKAHQPIVKKLDSFSHLMRLSPSEKHYNLPDMYTHLQQRVLENGFAFSPEKGSFLTWVKSALNPYHYLVQYYLSLKNPVYTPKNSTDDKAMKADTRAMARLARRKHIPLDEPVRINNELQSRLELIEGPSIVSRNESHINLDNLFEHLEKERLLPPKELECLYYWSKNPDLTATDIIQTYGLVMNEASFRMAQRRGLAKLRQHNPTLVRSFLQPD